MNVYTLSEYAYLRYDLDNILSEIGEFYEVRAVNGCLACEPLIRPPHDAHWASELSREHFNTLVPKIKSMHKDMYALLEAVAKHELKKGSVSAAFELMDPMFTPFRHLNNQFKHFSKDRADIDLISLAYISDKHDARIEPMFTIDGELFPYQKFVIMFLSLLEKTGAIELAGRKPLV